MRRFRSNIVIDGNNAWEEFGWTGQRLRIGETVYELQAVRVDRKRDRRLFSAFGRNKYDDFDSAFDEFETAVVFRLDPR